MAGKKGASRTRLRHGTRGNKVNDLSESFVCFAGNNGIRTDPSRHELPFADSHHVLSPSSLSLRDEARNTDRRSLWSSNVHLRHTQVNFVRAEDVDPNTLVEPRDEDRKSLNSTKRADLGPSAHPNTTCRSIHPTLEDCNVQEDRRDGRLDVEVSLDELSKPLESTSSPVPLEQEFLIDIVGSGTAIETGLMAPVLRSCSPSASSSGDEVVIFTGRSRTNGRRPSQVKSVGRSTTPSDTHGHGVVDSRRIEDWVPKISALTTDAVRVTAPAVRSLEENVILSQPVAVHKRLEQTGSNGNRKKRAKKSTIMIGQPNETEEASLADYIANISDGGQESNSFATTPIHEQGTPAAGTDEGHSTTKSSIAKRQAKNNSTLSSGWDLSDIEDLQDLSVSNDDSGAIQGVISKRERPSALQYLVVYEGYTVDDARSIRQTALESQSTLEQSPLQDTDIDSETSLLSGSQIYRESDTDDELEALRDEEDLLQRRLDRMTDEKLARLLAKQEELGMGSDEVLLFDDDFGDNVDDSDHIEAEHVSSTPKKFGPVRYQKQRTKRPKSPFHHATTFAGTLDLNSYSGFDVMDRERPSLKTMGRQSAQPFDISDTELQVSLSSAWHKDRLKKKVKKQEREELRAQGLLGKKNRKKADLQAKYLEGMTIDQVKDEIRGFIFSTNESLPLPPMDKKDRKTVHEIANAFSLKSKSVGGGRTRFPVLYKTGRTSNLSRDSLEVIESRLSRRVFMPRMDKRAKRGPVVPRRGAGRAAPGGAAFSYQDGEVVGATAPELGAENRGRAMLEKMGWSTGTALGASNNKGILQPVPHVVKTSKAGLG